MTPEQAEQVMAGLRAGHALRTIHASNIVTPGRLANHCEAFPEFGAEVRRLADANRKAIGFRRMEWQRAKTHCIHGHEFTPENVSLQKDGSRQCRTCNRMRAAQPRPISPEKVERIKALISHGVPLNSIYNGANYVAGHHSIKRQCSIDPELGRLVAEVAARNRKLTNSPERLALMRRRAAITRQRREADEYRAIRAMVPTYLPPDVRDDIVHNIMRAIWERSLRRGDIRSRVQLFVTQHNRMFPVKFAKFGSARLLSLDEVLFDDGAATRGDTVSEGLWA